MGFVKKGPRRRKRYVRGRRSKGRGGMWYLDKASKALSVAYAVKELVNVERKKLDRVYSGNITSTQNTPIMNFTQIAQGDSDTQREGNSIKVVGITLNYGWRATSGSTSTASSVRVVLVQDNQQIADLAADYTDVFNLNNIHSLLNRNTVGRFKILYDAIHIVSNANGTPGGNKKIYIPLQHHVRYNGNMNSDIQKGGIVLYALSDDAQGVSLDIQARTSYIDN